MRCNGFCRVAMISLALSLCVGCTSRSKVDSVIQGFFSEVNQSNFETAKSNYLSTTLINTLNSPQASHTSIQKSFENVVGNIKSVEVAGVGVKGEVATAAPLLLMPWGTKYSGRMELIKESGKEWKISDWEEFKALGSEHLSMALRQCFQFHKEAEAASEFQAAFAENSKDAATLSDWGFCSLALGNLAAAEEKSKQAIAMYPDVVWDAYEVLAEVYLKKGDLPSAEKALKKAISNKPDDATLYNSLAWFYADNAMKIDQAIELAQKGLSLSPDNALILDTLGWAYYRKGERTEALQSLTRARAKEPNNAKIRAHYEEVSTTAEVHMARALQFSNNGRLDQAMGECDAALRQEPNNDQAKNLKATLGKQAAAQHVASAKQEFDKQQYNPAMTECDTALRYDPKNTDAATLKAKIAEVKKVLGVQ